MKKALISSCGDCHEDKVFSDRLSESLWNIGIEPRRDYLKSPRAENKPEFLEKQFLSYDFIIPVLSPSYINDKWLRKELFQALTWEQKEQISFVIPLIIADCEIQFPFQRAPVDFRNADSYEESLSNLKVHFHSTQQIFVIMKFGDDELNSMYQLVIKPVIEKFGYSPLRIDEVQNSGIISIQILKSIDHSAIVIADLTGERPNCYFEAGYAFASKRELILTVRKGSTVHFDLAAYRFIEWNNGIDLKTELERRLTAIQSKEKT